MKFCEQCKASVGLFSRKKMLMPDGHVGVVCPTCAELLAREAMQRSMVARPPAAAEPVAEAPERLDAAPADLAAMPATPAATTPQGTTTTFKTADGSTVVTVRTESTTVTGGPDAAAKVREVMERLRHQRGVPGGTFEQLDEMLAKLESGTMPAQVVTTVTDQGDSKK